MMNRRNFIKTTLAGLSVCATNQSMASQLGLLNNAVLQHNKPFQDYKTLVTIFLRGGADSHGIIIPNDPTSINEYQTLRQHLASQSENLVAFSSNQFLTPNYCQSMVDLFENNDLSIVANVGPLKYPISKEMILADDNTLPLFIASHNTQQLYWQSAGVDPNPRNGWGGRIVELMNQTNARLQPNISLAKNQLFTSTLNLPTFTVDPANIQTIAGMDNPNDPDGEVFEKDTFVAINDFSSGILDSEYASRNIQTLENTTLLKSVIANIPETSVVYPNTGGLVDAIMLQDQFKTAAKLIEASPELEQNRQLIMIELNGFDTHDNQDRDLPQLLSLLFDHLKAFQADLTARGLDDRVVTFTQSDFGRTPSINANGTDHGWGGHQFVMGTPVKGGEVIGQIPEFGVDTSKIYQNMLIPDYSVEQYAANLGQWFGLSSSELNDVFPNLERFDDVAINLF